MPFTGDKYVGDLALYYIAKKLDNKNETRHPISLNFSLSF